jgi:predicted DNA-binding transcriptional regulator YafY
MDALSLAGFPVYAAPGPDGGYGLLDHYRTALTGLSAQEARAFFMLTIPAPLADLGVGQELRGALLKIAAALPAARRGDEERVRQRFHLDFTWWEQDDAAVIPHLRTVYQAVVEDRRLHIAYRTHFTPKIQRVVEPVGLVAKSGVWHLIYAGQGRLRVRRVAELLDARLSEETFTHPAGFDLPAFWAAWCAEQAARRVRYLVTLRVAPAALAAVDARLGRAARKAHTGQADTAQADSGGWITLEVSFASLEEARDRLLGFGRAVEVVAPLALRCSLRDYAEQIATLYAVDEDR